MRTRRSVQTPLEEVLSSKGRVRLLILLSRHHEMNVTGLAREAGLSYETTIGHLTALLEKGVVKEERVGRLRMFSMDEETPIGRKIKGLFSIG